MRALLLVLVITSSSVCEASWKDACHRWFHRVQTVLSIPYHLYDVGMHLVEIARKSPVLKNLRALEIHVPSFMKLAEDLGINRSKILSLPAAEQVPVYLVEMAERLNARGDTPLVLLKKMAEKDPRLLPFIEEVEKNVSAKGRRVVWGKDIYNAEYDELANEIRLPMIALGVAAPNGAGHMLGITLHEAEHAPGIFPVRDRKQRMDEYVNEHYQKTIDDEVKVRLAEIKLYERLIEAGLFEEEHILPQNAALREISRNPEFDDEEKWERYREVVDFGTAEYDAYGRETYERLVYNWTSQQIDLDIKALRAGLSKPEGDYDWPGASPAFFRVTSSSLVFQQVQGRNAFVDGYHDRIVSGVKAQLEEERLTASPAYLRILAIETRFKAQRRDAAKQ
jgi:hypothetical protein